jgi:ubiquinone/menaquinone biosynthesis C-methylase UbiE
VKFTKQQIPSILERLQVKDSAEILDLACGHGRHSIELAKRGYGVTGLDFSKHFIDIAKKDAKKQGVKVDFILGDMRDLPFVNKFDAIINMFISFGYFDNESDNELVLRNVSRALKPNGRFLIETTSGIKLLTHILEKKKVDKKTGLFVNVKKHKLSNGLVVTIKDEFNPLTFRWSMVRTWEEDGKYKNYKTNIRIFSPAELGNMMERNGLRVEKIWGDIQGSPFGFDSHRLVVLARKLT